MGWHCCGWLGASGALTRGHGTAEAEWNVREAQEDWGEGELAQGARDRAEVGAVFGGLEAAGGRALR